MPESFCNLEVCDPTINKTWSTTVLHQLSSTCSTAMLEFTFSLFRVKSMLSHILYIHSTFCTIHKVFTLISFHTNHLRFCHIKWPCIARLFVCVWHTVKSCLYTFHLPHQTRTNFLSTVLRSYAPHVRTHSKLSSSFYYTYLPSHQLCATLPHSHISTYPILTPHMPCQHFHSIPSAFCLSSILILQIPLPYVTVGITTPSYNSFFHPNSHSWHQT